MAAIARLPLASLTSARAVWVAFSGASRRAVPGETLAETEAAFAAACPAAAAMLRGQLLGAPR